MAVARQAGLQNGQRTKAAIVDAGWGLAMRIGLEGLGEQRQVVIPFER